MSCYGFSSFSSMRVYFLTFLIKKEDGLFVIKWHKKVFFIKEEEVIFKIGYFLIWPIFFFFPLTLHFTSLYKWITPKVET